jgi:hypothetical protein
VGAYRFERQPPVDGGKNAFEFDSSAPRAIAHKYGWDEDTVELKETDRTDAKVTFDVFAAEHGQGRTVTRRGILICLTQDEIRRRTDQYLSMSPSH